MNGGITIYGNIFQAHESNSGCFFSGGRSNMVENNIFYDCLAGISLGDRSFVWDKIGERGQQSTHEHMRVARKPLDELPTCRAEPRTAPITIDGTLDPAEWDGADPAAAITVDRSPHIGPSDALPSYAWIRRDGEALYIRLLNEVNPEAPLTRGSRFFGSDMVEVIIEGQMGVGTQGWWADEREHGPLLYLVGDFKGAFDSLQMAGLPRAARREAAADGQLCRARDGCLALERGVAHPVRVGVPEPTEDRGMLLQHRRGEEGHSGGRVVAALATGAGRLGGVSRDAGLELGGLERRAPAAEAIDRTTEARAIRAARLDLPPRTVPVVLSENPCRDGVLALKCPNRWTCHNHQVYWRRGRKAGECA